MHQTAYVDNESLLATNGARGNRPASPVWFVGAGVALGILFMKSEVLSWYRIQEMFRFQSFHMYGVIAGALVTATLGMQLITRLRIRGWNGEPINVPPKQATPTGARYWGGGMVFGLGWGLLGACPGPMFALVGAGVTPLLIGILAALAGTWVYAALQTRLPH